MVDEVVCTIGQPDGCLGLTLEKKKLSRTARGRNWLPGQLGLVGNCWGKENIWYTFVIFHGQGICTYYFADGSYSCNL